MKTKKQFRADIIDDYDFENTSEEYRDGYEDGIVDAYNNVASGKPVAWSLGFTSGAVLAFASVILCLFLFGLIWGYSLFA